MIKSAEGFASEMTLSSDSSAESKSSLVPRPRSSSFKTEIDICFFLGDFDLVPDGLTEKRPPA
jgi:hypothetical protein